MFPPTFSSIRFAELRDTGEPAGTLIVIIICINLRYIDDRLA